LRRGGVKPLAIDVRFMGATHRDLVAASEANTFRRDLYFRLAGFSLMIPPLRARRQQIMRLGAELLAAQRDKPPAITPAAALALTTHEWPGNVRELRNVMMRAAVLAGGGAIDAAHILFDAAAPAAAPPAESDERARVVAALEACAGNQTRAAALLGISRTTFVQKIRLYDIPRPRLRR
jgi:transcriptional regulator of acetoin/glycerol metabolism